MRKVAIFGATSAIAHATAIEFAHKGCQLFLVARDPSKLKAVADDIHVRTQQKPHTYVADLCDYNAHSSIWSAAESALQGVDTVLIAHGVLGDQRLAEKDFAEVVRIMDVNATSALSLLTIAANAFEQRKSGTIIAITSPAAERGRQSNYVYGASKAAVTVYLSGLRNRLFPSNVNVLTIIPGFVDTPMTRDFKKGPLWAKPYVIAKGIVRAVEKRKSIVYLPWFWKWIMLIIRSIPESIFKKLKL